MLFKKICLFSSAVSFLILLSCSHDPVYPTIGSLYVISVPDGAEIMVDGITSGQYTPAKIDGITVGNHVISLRAPGYKILKQSIEIRAGETRRIAVNLSVIDVKIIYPVFSLAYWCNDMAYDPSAGKIHIGFLANYIGAYSVHDSTLALIKYIDVGSPQSVIASSSRANRVYACTYGDTIMAIDFAADTLMKKLVPTREMGCAKIVISGDGERAYLANRLTRDILVIDTRSNTAIDTIELSNTPADIEIDNTSSYLYIAFSDINKMSKMDLNSRTIIASIDIGNSPGGMFWSKDYKELGVCNKDDKTISITSVGTFSSAICNNSIVYAQMTPAACFAATSDYIWALDDFVTTSGDTYPPSSIGLIYKPTWLFVKHLDLGMLPWRLAQSPDGNYLYVMEKSSKDIVVIKTEIN